MPSKHELQNILSGIGEGKESGFIQTAARFLRAGTQVETLKKSSSQKKRN